jgi:hypothetical protein
MSGEREQAIRKRAYEIWDQEGRPRGSDRDHWLPNEKSTPSRSGA